MHSLDTCKRASVSGRRTRFHAEGRDRGAMSAAPAYASEKDNPLRGIGGDWIASLDE
ncbi:hypothetical protein OKW30_007331 [Paraburkholderia sp. Clong3]